MLYYNFISRWFFSTNHKCESLICLILNFFKNIISNCVIVFLHLVITYNVSQQKVKQRCQVIFFKSIEVLTFLIVFLTGKTKIFTHFKFLINTFFYLFNNLFYEINKQSQILRCLCIYYFIFCKILNLKDTLKKKRLFKYTHKSDLSKHLRTYKKIYFNSIILKRYNTTSVLLHYAFLTSFDLKTLKILSKLKKKKKKYIDLYLILSNPKFLLINYKIVIFQLRKKNLSIYEITLDQVKYYWFKNLSTRILKGNFRFIQLTKTITLNNLKLFKLSNLKNQIVYQSINLILELIFEPHFSKNSYGFRPNKGCHALLKHLKLYWNSVNWVLQFNVQNFFSTLNSKRLINLLSLKTKDLLFLKLIKQFFKKNTNSKTLFYDHTLKIPILFNIYLNLLDFEILKIQKSLNLVKTIKTEFKFKFFEFKKFQTLNVIKYGSILTYKNKFLVSKLKNFRFKTHLNYVRYLNIFLLGFNCSKILVKKIEKYITTFCNSNLKLIVLNTKLFRISNNKINFLNFEIFFKKSFFRADLNFKKFSNKKSIHMKSLKLKETYRHKNIISIKAPLKIIKEYFIYNKLIFKSFKPKSVTWLLMYSNHLIVFWFFSLAKNILNYFCCCENFYKIKIYVDFIIRYSALYTLSLKNKLSLSQTLNKWSRDLIIKDNQNKFVAAQYFNKLVIQKKRKTFLQNINIDIFNFIKKF